MRTRVELLTALYGAFNERRIEAVLPVLTDDVDWPNAWEGGRVVGREAVREYWTRQWREIDSSVEPIAFTERGDGAIAVDARTAIRSIEGDLIEEAEVLHVYRFRENLVSRMDVEETTGRTRDPVSGISYAFEPAVEDLIVHSWLEPGGALPPHLHPIQEERWSVVEGSATFRLGDERRVYRPEDGEMLVPPGTVHGIESASDEVARLRTYVSPALRLQSFLEESAAAAQEGLFTQRGLPRGMRGIRWAASFIKRYGDETVFLSPPRPLQRILIALFARGGIKGPGPEVPGGTKGPGPEVPGSPE